MFAGTLTTGGVVSWTVTVNVLADEFPCASVALQVTVVAPSGKIEPDAGLQLAAAPPGPVASLVMFAGTLTTGGVVSWTVTVKLALLWLPAASVAVQLTVVAAIGNVEPEVGL